MAEDLDVTDELLTDELDLGTGHDDLEGNRYKVQQ